MSALSLPAASLAAFDARPVLASAPLKAGFDRSQLSRVGDMQLDLSPAVFRNNAQRCSSSVHFTVVEEPSAVPTLKAFLYLRLNHQAAGLRRPCPPAGLSLLFTYARRFLVFVSKELGACDLAQVDQSLLDAYLAHLKSARRARDQIAQHLETVADFRLLAPHLSGGGLTFAPWRGRSLYVVASAPKPRSKQVENLTPRIPENVIEPLLAWSIKYVKLFAPDIFAARAEWERLFLQRRHDIIQRRARTHGQRHRAHEMLAIDIQIFRRGQRDGFPQHFLMHALGGDEHTRGGGGANAGNRQQLLFRGMRQLGHRVDATVP